MVGAATLVRSVLYDRWITVLVSLLLIGGATAAMRGRTWGVALSLAAAIWFPAAALVGIAPPWFMFVGVAGVMPFVRLLPAFARFDKKATALLVMIAATLGTAGAIAWKQTAVTVFTHIPLLRPSLYANHGLLVGFGFRLHRWQESAHHPPEHAPTHA